MNTQTADVSGGTGLKGRRVLVAEDEGIIAMDLEMTLRDHGFDVVGTAATTAQSVEIARLHEPDLALMDLRLARGDCGIDAAAQLLTLGVPSLFVSGNLDDATVAKLAPLRPVGCLGKPVSTPRLVALLEGYEARLRG